MQSSFRPLYVVLSLFLGSCAAISDVPTEQCPSYIRNYKPVVLYTNNSFNMADARITRVDTKGNTEKAMSREAMVTAAYFAEVLKNDYVYVDMANLSAPLYLQSSAILDLSTFPESEVTGKDGKFFIRYRTAKTWGFDANYNTFGEFSLDEGKTWAKHFVNVTKLFHEQEICHEYYVPFSLLQKALPATPITTKSKILYRLVYEPKTAAEKQQYLQENPVYLKTSGGANLKKALIFQTSGDGTGVCCGDGGSGGMVPPPRRSGDA